MPGCPASHKMALPSSESQRNDFNISRQRITQEISRSPSSGTLRGFWLDLQRCQFVDRDSAESATSGEPARTRNTCSAILFGQIVTFFMAMMNVTSYSLATSYGVSNIQFFQLFSVYLLLSINLISSVQKKRSDKSLRQEEIPVSDGCDVSSLPPRRESHYFLIPKLGFVPLYAPWWMYLICSVLDVFPNCLTLLSFRYTSLTSTTLLGSLTVPSTMLFSFYILQRRFTSRHFAGVVLCITGGIFTVWSDKNNGIDHSGSLKDMSCCDLRDTLWNKTLSVAGVDRGAQEVLDDDSSGGVVSHHIVGDLMAVVAAVCYGLGDTIAEYSIKHIDMQEYLGMLGLFGLIISGCIFPWLEGGTISSIFFKIRGEENGGIKPGDNELLQICFLLVVYILSVYCYYMSQAFFLIASDATLLNMSLQAANLYAIGFSVMFYQTWPQALFYFATFLVVTGVFVYQRQQTRDENQESFGEASSRTEMEALRRKGDDNTAGYGSTVQVSLDLDGM